MSLAYREYRKQLAKLKLEAEENRQKEIWEAIQRIQTIMRKSGLTLADLEDAGPPKNRANAVAIKYRDDASGATWTGRGRTPNWLVGKDRASYLVRH